MILSKPSFEIHRMTSDPLELIELAGRTCYKSTSAMNHESARKFAAKILTLGHESVIEHASATVKIICDRGVSHEIVRHRIASFSQESTRYCNYKGGVEFIIPPWVKNLSPGEYDYSSPLFPLQEADHVWAMAMLQNETDYLELLRLGWTPQMARDVLPNSLKTELYMTANFREWLHFFHLRCSPAAHPQMREIAVPMLKEFRRRVPVIFDDVEFEEEDYEG